MQRFLLLILILLTFFSFGSRGQSVAFIENKGQIIDQNYRQNPSVNYLLPGAGMNVQLRRNGFSYDVWTVDGGRKTADGGRKTEDVETRHVSSRQPAVRFHRIDLDFVDADRRCRVIVSDPLPGRMNYYTAGTPVEGVLGVKSYRTVLYEDLYPGIDVVFSSSEGDKKFKYNFILKPGADLAAIKIKISGPDIALQPDGSLLLKTALGSIEEIIPESYAEKDGIRTPVSCHFHDLRNNVYGIYPDSPVPPDAKLVIDPMPQRVWGTYYGGYNNESSGNGTIDNMGNIYFCGGTSSPNLATSGSYQNTLAGVTNGIIVKFTAGGSRVWSTYYGGAATDHFRGITITQNYFLYLTGDAVSPDNIASPGAFQTTKGGNIDAMLVKFDSAGNRIWGTYYGGSEADGGSSCSADAAGNIYIQGETRSPSGLSTPGGQQENYGGQWDCYLAKFDPSGNRLWATYYGGECNDNPGFNSCKTDGNFVYIGGATCSTINISTPGSYQPVLAGTGTADAFLVAFTSSGSRVWGTYFGGTNDDWITGIVLSQSNKIYITGRTLSADGIASPGAFQSAFGGVGDLFLGKFLPDGQKTWSTYYGGSSLDEGDAVCLDINENCYLAGSSASTSGLSTSGAYQETMGGLQDGLLSKFDSAGNLLWGTYYGGSDVDWITGCDWFDEHHLYIFGITGSTDAIASPGAFQTSLAGGTKDHFVARFDVCPYPATPGAITGEDTVCTYQSGLQYSVPPVNNATGYQWHLPPGMIITSGNNTNVITVDVQNIASGGNIWVFGTNNCGNGDTTYFPVTVAPGTSMIVLITASEDTICAGTPVNFMAGVFFGGSTLSFQWKVNGINTGTSQIYTYTPANGDVITCEVTSSATTCLTNNPATSNAITMVVNPSVPVAVSITASQNLVCEGTLVTFTATQSVPGNLTYQWYVNGNPAGTNSSYYSYFPANNDAVHCSLITDHPCATGNPNSNTVTVTVKPILPVSVSITASQNPVCGNVPVTFTATANVPGNLSYHWYISGLPAGTNSPVFTYNPVNMDCVHCSVHTDYPCYPGGVPGNVIQLHVIETPDVIYSPCTDTITTTNAKPFRLRGAIPLGGIYSGPGVNPATGIFSPALAGTGLKTITYTYTNSGGCTDMSARVIKVVTASVFTCGNNFTDIRDNRSYATFKIGAQCWFAEDLDYGTSISMTMHQRDNCVAEKYQSTVGSRQSAVYQWDELMEYNDIAGDKGLCPPAWHVPTGTEWQTLFSNYTNSAFAAGALKYSGFSGFNALLTGIVPQNTTLLFYHFATYYWTSSSYGPYKAWAHGMNEPDPSVNTYPSARNNAFGVRCLKD